MLKNNFRQLEKMSFVSLAFFFLQLLISVKGELYWKVFERVTDYGQTLKLICVIGNDIKPIVGHWDRYIPDPSITFAVIRNESGRSDVKYSGIFVEDGFTLEIRNLSKEDLNLRYECSVDINRSAPRVLLEEDVIKGSMQLFLWQKVAKYGETLKLLCVTKSCNKKSCHWTKGWNKYTPELEILSIGENTNASSKYYSELDSNGFTLEIKNLSAADLDIDYQCVLPFNKSSSLRLYENDAFLVHSICEESKNQRIGDVEIIGIIIGVLIFLILVAVSHNRLRKNGYTSQPREDSRFTLESNLKFAKSCVSSASSDDKLDDDGIPMTHRPILKVKPRIQRNISETKDTLLERIDELGNQMKESEKKIMEQIRPTSLDAERDAFVDWIRTVVNKLDHNKWRKCQQDILNAVSIYFTENDQLKEITVPSFNAPLSQTQPRQSLQPQQTSSPASSAQGQSPPSQRPTKLTAKILPLQSQDSNKFSQQLPESRQHTLTELQPVCTAPAGKDVSTASWDCSGVNFDYN